MLETQELFSQVCCSHVGVLCGHCKIFVLICVQIVVSEYSKSLGQHCIHIVVCDAYEVWHHLAGYEVGTATFAMESKQAKQTN